MRENLELKINCMLSLEIMFADIHSYSVEICQDKQSVKCHDVRIEHFEVFCTPIDGTREMYEATSCCLICCFSGFPLLLLFCTSSCLPPMEEQDRSSKTLQHHQSEICHVSKNKKQQFSILFLLTRSAIISRIVCNDLLLQET